MDLLTHVLNEAGLVRRLLDLRQLDAHGALRFPCERSLGLHVVASGRLWVHAPTSPTPLELGPGDVALMARGCLHVLATAPSLGGLTVHAVTESAAAVTPGDALTGSRVMSGAYQLWNPPRHPLFEQLPPWFVLREADVPAGSPLAQALGLLRHELEAPQLGSQGVQHGLLDVVFTYVLRALLAQQTTTAGVSLILRDPAVHEAVTLLHREYAHAWTLDGLASRVGLSRTTFAERFRAAAGDTPLQYLRTIRMQQAMRLLGETAQPLDAVAVAVGYQDAFSFSKVFKRCTGLSPRDFRKREAEERALPYRFRMA